VKLTRSFWLASMMNTERTVKVAEALGWIMS